MGLVNVDIDLLRTLIAVAEAKSFTQAGERLFRTQSAISLQIKRLEELIGQRLFERGKDIRLTSSGEVVRSYAMEILKLNDGMLREVSHHSANVVLRIGTPDDYAQLILPGIIHEFASSNEKIEFQIVSDLSVNLARLVDSGEIDVALLTWARGITGINVVEEQLSWVVAEGSAALALDQLPLALFPEGCRIRDLAIAALDGAGKRWRIAYSANQFAPLRTAIASGAAIGVLPTRAVPKGLVRVGAEYGLPDLQTVELVIKIAPQASETVQRFAAAIASTFRSAARSGT
ncbi:MAG: LysR substrate-binding domain-containing protein [Polaromonas sp.]